MPPIVNSSHSTADSLNGKGICGTTKRRLGGYNGRCGYGPRPPLLVISPYSRVNYVDHTLTDQTSIIAFIEDNWLHGHRIGDGSFDSVAGLLTGMFDFHAPHAARVFLNPTTGLVESRG